MAVETPQLEEPIYQPTQTQAAAATTPMPSGQTAQVLPAQAGYVSKAGAGAYVANSILQGWLKGRQLAAVRNMQTAQRAVTSMQGIYDTQAQKYHSAVQQYGQNSAEAKNAYDQMNTAWNQYNDTRAKYLIPEQQQTGKKGKEGKEKGGGFGQALGGWAGKIFGKSGVTPQLFLSSAIQAARDNPPGAALTSAETAGTMQRREAEESRNAMIDWAKKQGLSDDAITEIKEKLAGLSTAKAPVPLSGTKPYQKEDGKYYQAMRKPDTGEIVEEAMPEGYKPQAGTSTEWKTALSTFAKSKNKDSNDLSFDDMKEFWSERYSAKQPYAQTKLKLAEENTAIAEANLALRKQTENVKEFYETQKQFSSSTKILTAAQDVDDYVNTPTGSGDVALALAFVDAIKPGSGFRFTDTERKWITTHSQGWAEGLMAKVQGGFTGTTLSPEQRQNMSKIIKKAASQLNDQKETILKGVGQFNPSVEKAVRGTQKTKTSQQMTAPPTTTEMITVRMPNGKTGKIHRSQQQNFLRDHPGSTVVTSGQ